jgi:hypothetical protein
VESINWSAVFIPALPMAKVVLRGTRIYLALFDPATGTRLALGR